MSDFLISILFWVRDTDCIKNQGISRRARKLTFPKKSSNVSVYSFFMIVKSGKI